MRLLTFLIFSIVSVNASALCFRINEQVRSNYSQSDAVFVAKVLSTRTWNPEDPVRVEDETSENDEDGVIFYKVQIQESIKGTLPVEVEVNTANNSGRVWLEIGKTYLLFASRDNLKGGGKSKHYWLHQVGCRDPNEFSLPSAEGRVKEAKDARRAFQDHEKAKIGVRVLKEEVPISGKRFSLKSKVLKKVGATGKDGWIWFEVPAGHYEVESKDDRVVEQVFGENKFTFKVPDGGGWDCVFVDRN